MKDTKSREIDVGGTASGKGAAPPRPFRGRARLVVCVLALAGLAFGCRWIWIRVREHVAARDDYRLTANDIAITDRPWWIRSDVRTEVLRDSGLANQPLSILDDGLVERIQRAFSLHPWVAKVVRVTKSHPAHVEVEVVYRRPVAMVEAPGGIGLYPVHIEGVVLPSDDFSPTETRAYPWLSGIESSPLGPTGTKWGDPVVAGGARIAAALQPVWRELGLRSIHWLKPTAEADPSAPALYGLVTAAGYTIAWGAAPGSELPGEPTAEQKIARLKGYIAGHGTLDEPAGGPRTLDLRQAEPPRGRPRDPNSGGVHLLAEFARIP